jgi:LPXTG-motif cell wall-anchored protein
VLLTAGAVAAAPAGAATEEERIPAIGPSTVATDACAASFPADAFDKAAPEGTVAPGQPVAIDVTWRPAWHSGDNVDLLGCVAANGHFVGGTVERGVANNGLWVHKFAVPGNAANDVRVCHAAIVIGPGAGDTPQAERTDADCFTVAAVAAKAEPAPAAANPAPAGDVGKETATPAAPAAAAPPTRTAASAAQPAPANPTPRVAAAAQAPKAPATNLPHTGARDRALVLVAGILLMVGGWAFGLGRRSALQ